MEIRFTEPIDTTGGKVRGYYQEDGLMVFKGIPYAEPPVGDKRWKPAEKYAYREGVRDCIEFSGSAWQNMTDDFSKQIWTEEFLIRNRNYTEDCLTLNIWAHEGGKKMPVILYFYGGGFVSGGSSCDIYDGTAFAKKDVIYVSFNHREGVLGWYANDDLRRESGKDLAGNYMLTDAIAALEWIRDNIAKFGGDSDNVTIWGQSAGAAEVNLLTVSPVAEKLFSRSVSMGYSSYMMKEWQPLDDISAKGNELEEKFGGSLEKMRAAAPEEYLPYFDGSLPAIDGYFTEYDPVTAVKKGMGAKKTIMMGFTDRDGLIEPWYFGRMSTCTTVEQFREVVKDLFPGREEELEKTYVKDNDVRTALVDICHDYLLLSVLDYAKARIDADPESETYIYFFNHVMPGPDSAIYGAFHSYEVPYFTEYYTDKRAEYWTDKDREIGSMVNDELVHFAGCGRPLSSGFVKSNGRNVYMINTDEQHDEQISDEKYEQLRRLFGQAE